MRVYENSKGFIPELLQKDTSFDWRLEVFVAILMISSTLISLAVIFETTAPTRINTFFTTIGVIAIWRYSWMLTHFLRAVLFLRYQFPKLRKAADETHRLGKVDHVYAIVMSYKVDPVELHAVYDALVKNAIDYGTATTIVASVTSHADRDILKKLWEENGRPQNIEIVTQFQLGDGKRSAMAMALRVISRRAPSLNSVTVFMDGDIILEPAALKRSIPFFLSNPDLGALTTNNDSIVSGGAVTREWYTLRYAQRHILMASMSLSRRLLVLTGRYSIFRTEHATDPEFIEILENDNISHWRFGRFKFVSGDDKSTWFYCMERGLKMLYLPDVKAYGLEELPDPDRFFKSAKGLMIRWFGNMMRTSSRAIGLGWRGIGFFTWWTLVDQRLSMWTTLVGPFLAVLFSVCISPVYLLFYLVWITASRFLFSILFGLFYGRFSFLWAPLLYYNQLYGSLLKIFMSFRLNRQGWTRQKLGRGEVNRWERHANLMLHISAFLAFGLGMGLISGQFDLPDPTSATLLASTLNWREM